VRALLPLLPGLVTSLVTQNHQQQSKTPKHHIVPVLNTILGGIALSLKQLTESGNLTQGNSQKFSFFFTNKQTQMDFDMIGHKKTLEWIPILISIVDLLQKYEVENHTDWLDIEKSEQDLKAKEFQITSCVDLVLDSICTLLISSMRTGGKTTVATLQRIKSCTELTKIIQMTLNRCSHIGSRSFSEALCSGVARLCVFLEEHQDLEWDEKINWTLIEMLQRGRHASGWYQASNTTIPHPKHEIQNTLPPDEGKGIRKKLTQFVDENLIQTSSEIYHTLKDDQLADQSFEHRATLYLPILQPSLRIILLNVTKVSSDKEFNSEKTLLQHIAEEIELSVTAALVGMTFSNARDIGLGCISSMRTSIVVHKSKNDSPAVTILEKTLIKIASELRERYEIERNSKHAAQYTAYEEGDGEEDGENSKVVEQLIFGNDKLTEDNQDFILYPESLSTNQVDSANKSKTVLGWSKYSGLGNTLDSCFDVKGNENADAILLLLKPFLDEWDAAAAMEKQDMINLFDDVDSEFSVTTEEKQNDLSGDAAGDAAAQYIELSSAEKQRQKEVDRIFSSLMYLCESSASKLCWEKWMEYVHPNDQVAMEWERSIGERGGRNIYSRLGTSWISPQFPKFIPEYLDHSKNIERESVSAFDGEFDLGGQVEIVDITKKNYFEEDSEKSDGEGSLGFPESRAFEEEDQVDEPTSITDNSKKPSIHHRNNNPISLPFSSTNVQTRTSLSSFSYPPDTSAPHDASLISSSQIETYCENILHVRSEGSRKGVLLVTKTHLIIDYYHQYYDSEIMAMEESKNRRKNIGETNSNNEDEINEFTLSINTFGRPNSCRFLISEITQAHLRRYRLRDSAMELFFLSSGGSSSFSGSSSLFLDFGPGAEGNERRDAHATHIMKCAPQNSLKQYPEKSSRFLQEQLQKVTVAWIQGSLSNFDYLMQLNILSGRSFNDLCQYPVMPWVLSNYHSAEIPDLNDPNNFRDMTKPMGALNEKRLEEFIERFETFSDPNIPPFMYGSHYSTSAGVVLHFLVRLHPFAGLHRHLQGGHFDVADRLFCNVQRTWETW